jgi:hypothetical protein
MAGLKGKLLKAVASFWGEVMGADYPQQGPAVPVMPLEIHGLTPIYPASGGIRKHNPPECKALRGKGQITS